MEQLEMLWHLQEIDLAIRELEEKLAHHPLETKVEEARRELGRLVEARAETAKKLNEHRRKQKLQEFELHRLLTERSALQKKLYGGEIGNVRELETLEKKLKLVENKIGALEEAIIVLMETTEELEAHLKDEQEREHLQERAVAAQESVLDETKAELRAELEQRGQKREAAITRIENRYLDLYTRQSGRHHGQGIARVINDNCEGCRVFISSAQRGSLYNPRAMVYCENCGRLLVRLQLPPQCGTTLETGEEDKGEKRENQSGKPKQAAGERQ